MSTITAPTPRVISPVDRDDSRIVLEGLSWTTFLRILDETGDHRRTRSAFNRGVLELMYPGPIHEGQSRRVNKLVEIVAEETGIPYGTYGSTTWIRGEAEKGIEADECYYFSPDKIAAADELTRQNINDSTRYPRPDLVVEIDIRRSALDRHEIYAALGVPELWSYSGGVLRVEILGPDGVYADALMSGFIPIPPKEIARWMLEREKYLDDGAWARSFRAWVRAFIA